jgi:hypothetical protein
MNRHQKTEHQLVTTKVSPSPAGPTMKPPDTRSGQVGCMEALVQTMGKGSEIRKNEMAIRKNPSFEYYCRVLAILPSRSLSRVN